MNIEHCKNGQRVEVGGKRGVVMFPTHDSYTGKIPMIRVMLDERAPTDEKSGYDGENFQPEQVELVKGVKG